MPLGTLCDIEARGGSARAVFRAEVVRVDRDNIILSPLEDSKATFSGALVTARAETGTVAVVPAASISRSRRL